MDDLKKILEEAIASGYNSIKILKKELKEAKSFLEEDKIREQIANEKRGISICKGTLKGMT